MSRFALFIIVLIYGLPLSAQDPLCTEYSPFEHINRGETFEAEGQDAEARFSFECATQIDETSATAWQKLGDLAFDNGDNETALSAYQRVQVLSGDDTPSYIVGRLNRQTSIDQQTTVILVVVAVVGVIILLIVIRFLTAMLWIIRERPWRYVADMRKNMQFLSQVNVVEMQQLAIQMQQQAEHLKDVEFPTGDNEAEWATFVNSPHFAQVMEMLNMLPIEALRQAGINIPEPEDLRKHIESVVDEQQRESMYRIFDEDDNPIQPL